MNKVKIFINKILKRADHRLVKIPNPRALPFDMDLEFRNIYEACAPFTKTSKERIYAMYKGTEYIERANIPGAIVECGIWRGGSVMVSMLTLGILGKKDREFYLYDTYAGMVEPESRDITVKRGAPAHDRWEKGRREGFNAWAYASLQEVKHNIGITEYPEQKISYIQGKVEETIPKHIPEKIALLRIDTDWYSSTKHELIHLFPRLSSGGVLIIDDHGCFQGAKDAVDEYIKEYNIPLLLHRVDGSGRVAVKIV